MQIRIHTAGGISTYYGIDEMPEGIHKGFAAWMIMTGECFLTIHDTVIEIIEKKMESMGALVPRVRLRLRLKQFLYLADQFFDGKGLLDEIHAPV
ncbi:hypothetical protein [Pelodictyon luteolum]|uniref:hypothetical protein n=1 Tax=Pelodictyon luteolum TaxID=1100 RepID=UPI0026E9CA56|nr:hypothetical protein [Pelodictyon luteolum]